MIFLKNIENIIILYEINTNKFSKEKYIGYIGKNENNIYFIKMLT